MIAAEFYIVHDMLPASMSICGLDSTDPGYLPIMFIGIYCFILLAGPGKISLDYMLSLHLLNKKGGDEKKELEEV